MAWKNLPEMMGRFFRAVLFLALAVPACLATYHSARAQTIREVSGITFGRIALIDNSAPYAITIDRFGTITKDSAIAIIEAGQPAEYLLEGYLPSTLLNISVTAPTTTTRLSSVCCPATDNMTINAFDYPVAVVTDALGTAVLNVGATLTTGSGGVYIDGVYHVALLVTVSY